MAEAGTSRDEKSAEKRNLLAPPRQPREHLESATILQIDPDKLLDRFGTFGRFQCLNAVLVAFPSLLYAAAMMVMPFLLEEPPVHECVLASNAYELDYKIIDKCTVWERTSNTTRSCIDLMAQKITYFAYPNSTVGDTLTTYYDLVCERESDRNHAESTFLIGSMIGAYVISQLSDKYGRKNIFIGSIWLGIAGMVFSVVVTFSFYAFLLGRLISGFALGGNLAVNYVLLAEVVAMQFREYTPFVATFFWVGGFVWAGVTYMIWTNWKLVTLAICAPGLLSVFYIWYFPESLHWMISNRKTKGIRAYIHAATRMNGVTIDYDKVTNDVIVDGSETVSDETLSDEEEPTSCCGSIPFVRLIMNPKICFLFVICCLAMSTMNMTYWVLSLESKDMSENKMTGFFLSALIEWPGCLLAVVSMKFMKRRPLSCSMFFLSGLCLVAFVLFHELIENDIVIEWAALSLPLLAKMFNAIVWAVLPLAMSEMVPTPIRNTFCGSVAFVGDLGSVVSPYLEYLTPLTIHAPKFVIIIFSIVCAISVLALPETKGLPLVPDMASLNEGAFLRFVSKFFRKEGDGIVKHFFPYFPKPIFVLE